MRHPNRIIRFYSTHPVVGSEDGARLGSVEREDNGNAEVGIVFKGYALHLSLNRAAVEDLTVMLQEVLEDW